MLSLSLCVSPSCLLAQPTKQQRRKRPNWRGSAEWKHAASIEHGEARGTYQTSRGCVSGASSPRLYSSNLRGPWRLRLGCAPPPLRSANTTMSFQDVRPEEQRRQRQQGSRASTSSGGYYSGRNGGSSSGGGAGAAPQGARAGGFGSAGPLRTGGVGGGGSVGGGLSSRPAGGRGGEASGGASSGGGKVGDYLMAYSVSDPKCVGPHLAAARIGIFSVPGVGCVRTSYTQDPCYSRVHVPSSPTLKRGL